MEIYSYGRYGDSQKATGAVAIEQLVRERVEELCEEQFPTPDYEHCEVSVSRADGWYISANLSGLVTLGRHENDQPNLYLYGIPAEELVQLFLQLARGEMDTILDLTWAPHWRDVMGREDFYLLASRPDLTDLHRAARKGDLEWIEAELRAGANVNALDRFGATPLHAAALASQIDACRRLLAAGADPGAKDEDGADAAAYARHADFGGPVLIALLDRAAEGGLS